MEKIERTEMMDRIVLAATLYYKEKLSQQEIAKRMGVSRPWISKLLTKAEELGIVKIEIQSPIVGNELLEKELRSVYPHTDIRVIDTSDDSKDYLAIAAVHYFVSKIQPSDTIGIGWGNAISRFVEEMVSLNFDQTSIVPLAGSFGTSFDILPNYNSIKLAEKIGGEAKVLHVPAYCKTQEEYETLMNNEDVQKILSMGENADILVVGIGTFSSSFLTKNHIFSLAEQEQLIHSNAVGDVVLQFLDKNGQPVETEMTKRLIHIDLMEARKKSGHIIGIAQGVEKKDILMCILENKLIDTLFIDIDTAKAILSACRTA